jgi:hypothetical protein
MMSWLTTIVQFNSSSVVWRSLVEKITGQCPYGVEIMTAETLLPQRLEQSSTEALKQDLLSRVEGQDTASLKQKVRQCQALQPLFKALSQRNPYPSPVDQRSHIIGAWRPLWSTIPYQDILPGRIRSQSYQIFHDNGYYANLARYALGHQSSFWRRLPSILIALDLMIIQRFSAQRDRWQIQNVAVKQALQFRAAPLAVDKAEDWFAAVVQRLDLKTKEAFQMDGFFDRSTTKKLKTAFQATPEFEHLYIDSDFRIVKTRREAKQRFSYTVAVRLDS